MAKNTSSHIWNCTVRVCGPSRDLDEFRAYVKIPFTEKSEFLVSFEYQILYLPGDACLRTYSRDFQTLFFILTAESEGCVFEKAFLGGMQVKSRQDMYDWRTEFGEMEMEEHSSGH